MFSWKGQAILLLQDRSHLLHCMERTLHFWCPSACCVLLLLWLTVRMGRKTCQDAWYFCCGQSERWEDFYLPFWLWVSGPRGKENSGGDLFLCGDACPGGWRRGEQWRTSMQRIPPHLAHKSEAQWKINSKRNKISCFLPAHLLVKVWGFYQVPGDKDITELTFLNPHLLIGNVTGLL